MNGGLTDYQEQAFLDSILTGFVGLFSDVPTDSGGTEITGADGYARQAITSTRTGSQIANNATLTYGPASTADWVRVKGFKVFDALTAGNGKYHGELIHTKTIYTVDPSTDTFTSSAHGLANGTLVVVRNKDGNIPGGLSAASEYYIIGATTNTFQLSATQGGAAINITSAGDGTNAVFICAYKTLTVGSDTLQIAAGELTFSLD